jgi:hypothetical protein
MKIIFLLLVFSFSMLRETEAQTFFIWPVKAMPSYSEVTDFYVVNNYVDQDPTPDTLDWNCLKRSYDGHTGVDIDLWPFHWSMMDNNHIAAIAAAPGRVVAIRVNGNNENNCGQKGENPPGNYIAIRHADSSTSFYFHIRDNSAQVALGQQVVTGQILAFVGSSGSSSNPHLHFEVNTNAVNFPQQAGLIDPYSGPCNSLNKASWWQNQKSYQEPAIVRVMTHGGRPSLPGYDNNPGPGFCRSGEIKNAKASFAPNDSVYIGVAMRDFIQSAGHSFNIKVYFPDGLVWLDENKSANTDFNRRYYTFDKKIPSNAPTGTYKAEVTFNGTSGVYFFTVNCPASENVTGTLFGYRGYKAASAITASSFLGAGNRLLLQAGSEIHLLPGFAAQNGSVLKARIRDCNYSE